MPFDLYISRASSFGAVLGEPATAEKQGFFSGLFSKRSESPPVPPSRISVEEFHALMESAPATKKGDVVYWVRHAEGDPWFAAEWKTEGHIVLSASYTHHRFLRNLGDMFDQGLRMAAGLTARFFEEVGGREVTVENIDELLDTKGRYLALQASTWRKAMDMLDSEVKAPLEYPLGPIDSVSEFLSFRVVPQRKVTPEAIRSALERDVGGTKVEVVKEDAMVLVGADDEKWLAKVKLRADGEWQVWPAHGHAAFPRIAHAVVQAAECIHSEVQGKSTFGQVHFRGRPYDETLRREVHSHIDGLSVDFFTWMEPPAEG